MKISQAIIKSTFSFVGKKIHENLNEKRIQRSTLGLDIEDGIYVNSSDIPKEKNYLKEFVTETIQNICSCAKCGSSVRSGATFCPKCNFLYSNNFLPSRSISFNSSL